MILFSPNCSDLGVPNIEIKKFPDGENYLRVPSLKDAEGNQVTLFHRAYPSQDSSLIQLFLLLKTLKRATDKITAVIPYLPYARQDKMVLEGESKSSESICNIISESGCKELVTFDAHFLKMKGTYRYGNLKIRNLSLSDELISYLYSECTNPVIISPDKGASYMVVERGGLSMEKKRKGYEQSELAERKVSIMKTDAKMEDRDVIIIDDMIAGGGTMARAVDICKKKGARKIYCGATHGLFLGDSANKILSAGAEEIVVSNTILSPYSKINFMDKLRGLI
ncbi:MAG: ribose-phosphate diphosphokinase [Candidatus Anstonellales archaeon]